MTTEPKMYKFMFEYHRRTADDYATRSHENSNRPELQEGYSALAEAHNQFAMIVGKLAGADLSQLKGEM